MRRTWTATGRHCRYVRCSTIKTMQRENGGRRAREPHIGRFSRPAAADRRVSFLRRIVAGTPASARHAPHASETASTRLASSAAPLAASAVTRRSCSRERTLRARRLSLKTEDSRLSPLANARECVWPALRACLRPRRRVRACVTADLPSAESRESAHAAPSARQPRH